MATSDILTGPIRLLFPRLPGSMGEAADFPFSLLGALCLPRCVRSRRCTRLVPRCKLVTCAAGQAQLAC